jgi:hypothetical protein
MTDYMFCKLGKPEYLLPLLVEGVVYMQRVRAFRAQDNNAQGDTWEGSHSVYRKPTSVAAIVAGERIPLPGVSLAIGGAALDHGVYCLFGFRDLVAPVSSKDLLKPFVDDPRFSSFGDAAVVFYETAEFKRRLEAAASAAGFELDSGPVDYVGADYNGPAGPFVKRHEYSYQSEIRFVTRRPIPDAALTLRLGSLRDVAELYDLLDPDLRT